MRQHIMQKLHNMPYVSAYLKSYSTRPIVLPKLPASVINLDFLKIAHEKPDTITADGTYIPWWKIVQKLSEWVYCFENFT